MKSLSELYFEFIDLMNSVGQDARGELRCSDFTDEDEKVAKESIEHYKGKIAKLNKLITLVEDKAKKDFNW